MCRFLSLDFEHTLRCSIDRMNHTVRFQAYPQLRDHVLDVVACDAVPRAGELRCGKACRGLVESGMYWQEIYPESVSFGANQ